MIIMKNKISWWQCWLF